MDYREGTDMQPNVRKLVGLRKYTNITLKRGYTQRHIAVGLVHKHPQRRCRSAQRDHHFDE